MTHRLPDLAPPPPHAPLPGPRSPVPGSKSGSWRRRFFALKGPTLFYFASASSRAPLGSIPLEGALVAAEQLLVPSARRAPPRALHTLQIALSPWPGAPATRRAYLLAAPSPQLQVED